MLVKIMGEYHKPPFSPSNFYQTLIIRSWTTENSYDLTGWNSDSNTLVGCVFDSEHLRLQAEPLAG